MPKDQDTPRLASLRRKLRSRDGTPGYEKNCEHLRAEIARLEGTGKEFDL